MKADAVTPAIDTYPLLSGAQFRDAFSVKINDAALDARHAAEKMLTRGPRWIDILIALRNLLVTPFGLKTPAPHGVVGVGSIGIFPVITETRNRLVAGFDDKHLDFRVVVDVAPCGPGQRVTATTLVMTHNWLGRIYLMVILPFHRVIVRAMLRQITA